MVNIQTLQVDNFLGYSQSHPFFVINHEW